MEDPVCQMQMAHLINVIVSMDGLAQTVTLVSEHWYFKNKLVQKISMQIMMKHFQNHIYSLKNVFLLSWRMQDLTSCTFVGDFYLYYHIYYTM